MNKYILRSVGVIGFLVALWAGAASASTYAYLGQLMTQGFPSCSFSACFSNRLTGSVDFNFDTSNFSGTVSLSPGDTARLSPVYSYPYTLPPPIDDTSYRSTFTGVFTFDSGDITDWAIYADIRPGPLCGLGPACSSMSYSASSPSGDTQVDGTSAFSNSLKGQWSLTSPVAAVPEPSTWAMLLIGFASVGFTAYRRKMALPSLKVSPTEFVTTIDTPAREGGIEVC
jgi:hypothetical protein